MIPFIVWSEGLSLPYLVAEIGCRHVYDHPLFSFGEFIPVHRYNNDAKTVEQ